MEHLYAPWRSTYLKEKQITDICPFCITWKEEDDEKKFLIKRFEECALFLNIFPYNAGHLLIAPYDHKAELYELSSHTRYRLVDACAQAHHTLKKMWNLSGCNIGINSGGAAAGGTIPDHLHIHILPRFLGDTNFLATVAHTKTISFDLREIYTQLRKAFLI